MRWFLVLLASFVFVTCGSQQVDSTAATLEVVNRVASAITGRTDIHGSIDAGLDAIRRDAAEHRQRADDAYRIARENGATVEDAKKSAEEAGKYGTGNLLGLAGIFVTGALSYFRRNSMRGPEMADVVAEAVKHLDLVTDSNKAKLVTLKDAIVKRGRSKSNAA